MLSGGQSAAEQRHQGLLTTGLWGAWLKNGADNLVKNVNIGNRLVRGIAIQGLQPGTVITSSKPTH